MPRLEVEKLCSSNICEKYITEATTQDYGRDLNYDSVQKKKCLNTAVKLVQEKVEVSHTTCATATETCFEHRVEHSLQESTYHEEDEDYESEHVCLLHLQHLYDKPINWSLVDRPQKTNLLASVEKIFNNFIKPDIFIRIGNHHFNCHLMVLQTYGAYFNDCKHGQNIYFKEETVPSSAFRTAYMWMLKTDNSAQEIMTRRNVLDLLKTSLFLKIVQLEEQCWSFIDCPNSFMDESALLLYLDAMSRKLPDVMELMKHRVTKSFLPLVASDVFDELPVGVVCMLLSSSSIEVRGEVEVFMSGVKWLLYDWENRKEYAVDVMRCVRFGLMQPWQLVDIRRNLNNPECMKITEIPDINVMITQAAEFSVYRTHYAKLPDSYRHTMGSLISECPEPRNWIDSERTYVTLQSFLDELVNYTPGGIYLREIHLKRDSSTEPSDYCDLKRSPSKSTPIDYIPRNLQSSSRESSLSNNQMNSTPSSLQRPSNSSNTQITMRDALQSNVRQNALLQQSPSIHYRVQHGSQVLQHSLNNNNNIPATATSARKHSNTNVQPKDHSLPSALPIINSSEAQQSIPNQSIQNRIPILRKSLTSQSNENIAQDNGAKLQRAMLSSETKRSLSTVNCDSYQNIAVNNKALSYNDRPSNYSGNNIDNNSKKIININISPKTPTNLIHTESKIQQSATYNSDETHSSVNIFKNLDAITFHNQQQSQMCINSSNTVKYNNERETDRTTSKSYIEDVQQNGQTLNSCTPVPKMLLLQNNVPKQQSSTYEKNPEPNQYNDRGTQQPILYSIPQQKSSVSTPAGYQLQDQSILPIKTDQYDYSTRSTTNLDVKVDNYDKRSQLEKRNTISNAPTYSNYTNPQDEYRHGQNDGKNQNVEYNNNSNTNAGKFIDDPSRYSQCDIERSQFQPQNVTLKDQQISLNRNLQHENFNSIVETPKYISQEEPHVRHREHYSKCTQQPPNNSTVKRSSHQLQEGSVPNSFSNENISNNSQIITPRHSAHLLHENIQKHKPNANSIPYCQAAVKGETPSEVQKPVNHTKQSSKVSSDENKTEKIKNEREKSPNKSNSRHPAPPPPITSKSAPENFIKDCRSPSKMTGRPAPIKALAQNVKAVSTENIARGLKPQPQSAQHRHKPSFRNRFH